MRNPIPCSWPLRLLLHLFLRAVNYRNKFYFLSSCFSRQSWDIKENLLPAFPSSPILPTTGSYGMLASYDTDRYSDHTTRGGKIARLQDCSHPNILQVVQPVKPF
jgi:hypothetical protein